MTLVVSDAQDFRAWCGQHGITNCVAQSVRHINHYRDVWGLVRATPDTKVVVLSSYNPGVVSMLSLHGYQLPTTLPKHKNLKS